MCVYQPGYGQGASIRVLTNGNVYFYYDAVMQSNLTVTGTLYGNNISFGTATLGSGTFGSLNTSSLISQSVIQSGNFVPFTNNSGNIGTWSQAFNYVVAYGIYNLSDSRQKENIRSLDNALSVVSKLKGYKYDIKKEFSNSDSLITKEKQEIERKNKIGFLAQDVYAVLPEAVYHDDSTDVYAINYSSIIPVLVEAIKELTIELENLKNKRTLKSAEVDEFLSDKSEPYLKQNIPNPFNVKTKIEMFIPSESSISILYLYNLQGIQIKAFDINQKGYTFTEIEASLLKPGMYLYTLVIDGRIIDTKRMIITN